MDPVKFSELYNSFVAIEKSIHKGVSDVFLNEKEKWQSLMQVYGSDLPEPPTQPIKRKHVACKYCDKIYSSNGGLYYHIQSVHMGIKYTCHVCARLFSSKTHLHRHIQTVHTTQPDASIDVNLVQF